MAQAISLKSIQAMSMDDVNAWASSLSLQELSQLEAQMAGWAWVPNPGPQTQAYLSEAEILFYGGSAGGGKTDLLLGLGINEHDRSVIFRREYAQLRSIEDRLLEMLPRDSFNRQVHVAQLPSGGVIEFGACQRLGDEQKWQGRAHDFIGFDEVPHFLFQQYIFLRGWRRTTKPGQRTRVVMAGNPPQSAEGAWIIEHMRPWLDRTYPYPAKPGELRYFWRDPKTGEDREVEKGYTETIKGVTYKAESRTFIPAALHDNPHLRDTEYGSNLNMLPEPLRSQLLFGQFDLTPDDRPWQLIPNEWVMKAQARWSPSLIENLEIEQIGADIARGGKDRTVIYSRFQNIVLPPIGVPGKQTPDGGSVAAMIVNLMGKQFGSASEPLTVVDAIGVGSSVVDHLRGKLKRFYPLNVSNKCPYLDRAKKFKFVNMRAYIWWQLRELLDPDGPNPIAIPPSPALIGDLTGIDWKLTPSGIQVEAKDDVKKRIGRSPDEGDALAYCFAPAAEGGQGILDFMRGLANAEAAKKLAEQAERDKATHIFTHGRPPS